MSLYDKIVKPTTQMLLKRIETNPEDFSNDNIGVYGLKNWLAITKHGEFNLVERLLINRKVVALRRAHTEQAILGLLLDGQAKEKQDDLSRYTHTTVGRFNIGESKVNLIKEIKNHMQEVKHDNYTRF